MAKLLSVVVISIVFCEVVCATCSDANGGVVSDSEERAIDKGMEPLYTLTRGFLDIVQPKREESILDVYEIEAASELDEDGFLQDNWQKAAKFYIGYVVCIAVGVVFFVVFPIAGLIVCCCRCCCRNCGSRIAPKSNRDGCSRVVCGIFLAVFNTLMLLGMVSAFMTNELIREQTCTGQSCDRKFTDKLGCGVGEIQRYSHNTVELVDSDAIFKEADNLSAVVTRINNSLHDIVELSSNVSSLSDQLSDELNNTKQDLLADLATCNTPECNDLRTSVNDLRVSQDFSALPNLTFQQSLVKGVLGSDLGKLILDGRNSYENITADVQETIHTGLKNAESAIEDVIMEVDKEYRELTKSVDDAMGTLNSTYNDVIAEESNTETYGDYRYYVSIGICCLVLLVVLFYYLGLSFGACGEAPDDGASCCNRGAGATILMFGVVFTFIFWWILMLVLVLLFVSGGVFYTEVCRPVQNLENSGVMPVVDHIIAENTDYNYSIVDVLSDCKNNNSIYNAFDLEQYVNLTELLDLDSYGINDKVKEIEEEAGKINLTKVEIISPSLLSSLTDLIDASLDTIDFDAFHTELSKNITSKNLTQLAAELEAQNISASSLREIQQQTVAEITSSSHRMRSLLNTLEQDIGSGGPGRNFSQHVADLVHELTTAQNFVRTNGTQVIVKFAVEFGSNWTTSLSNYAESLESKLMHDVGRCGILYSAFDLIINEAMCSDVLNPYNGFWFSLGWCLFFGLPSLILALCLSGYYRKPDDYTGSKTFDDPNYDAYAGPYPGDNIPLEDVHRGKAYRADARQGQNNTGYERDNHTNLNGIPPDYDDWNSSGRGGGGDAQGYRGYGGGGNRDVPRTAGSNGFGYDSTSVPYSPPHYNNRSKYY